MSSISSLVFSNPARDLSLELGLSELTPPTRSDFRGIPASGRRSDTLLLLKSDNDASLMIFLPAAIGITLIFAGYRAFRYGEEVEQRDKAARKASQSGKGALRSGWRAWESNPLIEAIKENI